MSTYTDLEDFLRHAEPGEMYREDPRRSVEFIERTAGYRPADQGGKVAVINTYYNGMHTPGGLSFTLETVVTTQEMHATDYGISSRIEHGREHHRIAVAAEPRYHARRAAKAHTAAVAEYRRCTGGQ